MNELTDLTEQEASPTRTIVERIKQVRLNQGLTQEALSELVGVSIRTYQRMESYEHPPRIDIIFRILNALGINPTAFFSGCFERIADPTVSFSQENSLVD